MNLSRRGLLGGLVGIVAAPALVRASSLMPVRAPKLLTSAELNRRLLYHGPVPPSAMPGDMYLDATYRLWVACGTPGRVHWSVVPNPRTGKPAVLPRPLR